MAFPAIARAVLRTAAVLVAGVLASVPCPTSAGGVAAPGEHGTTGGERGIVWLYDSPLCVTESIDHAGPYAWKYTYSFENVDDAHIWHFAVYARYAVTYPPIPWTTHPDWTTHWLSVSLTLPIYDARNLDPKICCMTNTWGPGGENTADPIDPGETVSGYSFISPILDTAPKYYFYETTETGYAGDTGIVTAVGVTCSASTSVDGSVDAETWGRTKSRYR
jgi:hypothetical protein